MKKRKGAASFYIVIFSTLLLTVISVAFVTAVMNDANRTVDADLSQSAYDSALAGIEDAKIAISRYQGCLLESNPGSVKFSNDLTCKDVIDLMNSSFSDKDCNIVGKILGRIHRDDNSAKEFYIQEIQNNGENTNNMEQAYTCVTLGNVLKDYRATLTSENMTHVVPLKLKDDAAKNAKSIRVSWYSDTDGTIYNFRDIISLADKSYVSFPKLTSEQVSVPPTIAVELIQTGPEFTITDLDKVGNRGKLFLVPSSTKTTFSDNKKYGYKKITQDKEKGTQIVDAGVDDIARDYMDITGTYDAYEGYRGVNVIRETNNAGEKVSDQMNFTKSNMNEAKNVPVMVYCPNNEGNEFACSVSIELPKPADKKERNPNTFMVVLSLPYGRPDTDFSIEVCTDVICSPIDADGSDKSDDHLSFANAQYNIDSTGRANDLFRRVEVRAENYDPNFPVPTYAVQLDGKDSSMIKSIISNYTSKYYRVGDDWDGK